MTEELTTLEGLTTGQYIVTTWNYTRYFVDLDANVAIRRGAPGREWGNEIFVGELGTVGGSRPKAVGRLEGVTPDGEPFHYWTIQDAEVGKRMRLDNRDEWRITSEIRTIERDEGHDGGGVHAG